MLTGPMRGLGAIILATIPGACAGLVNQRLDAYGPGGYRYANVRVDSPEEERLVVLAFSDGGTRAAAFSHGLLEGLQSVR